MNSHTFTIDDPLPSPSDRFHPSTDSPNSVESHPSLAVVRPDESEIGPFVLREATIATANIHDLLRFVRKEGIMWVPDSFGLNEEGKHVVTYMDGIVIQDLPYWIWKDSLLVDIAHRLRTWHDITTKFKPKTDLWNFTTDEPYEVICHNDFAPYNCVFMNYRFVGLIGFDLCSPGSRLWDIACTAYRFIPLMPDEHNRHSNSCSPFDIAAMRQRLAIFLDAYAHGDTSLRFDEPAVYSKACKLLFTLIRRSNAGTLDGNHNDIRGDTLTYSLHADWIRNQL